MSSGRSGRRRGMDELVQPVPGNEQPLDLFVDPGALAAQQADQFGVGAPFVRVGDDPRGIGAGKTCGVEVVGSAAPARRHSRDSATARRSCATRTELAGHYADRPGPRRP